MLDKDRRGSEDWPYLRGKRILVLEDDPVIAVEWYFQLKRLGATQVFEPTNRLALEYLVRHNVDAAIVDYTLRDGCCTPILELLTARHIPFIIVSGDTFAMRQASIGAPVLSKPVTPAEVWSALSGVLH
jgi:CheY-like chemotaxis protein